jgi:hypothetical protein
MDRMIKMVELRKAIQAILATVGTVYYQQAHDNAVYPYLVYDFPNSTDDGTLERFVMDLDGWDDKADTTALETLMDEADTLLHRANLYTEDKVCASIYRENRLSLTDEDRRIRRRKIIYQVRTY